VTYSNLHDKRQIIQVLSAGGWVAKFTDESKQWSEPLAAWALTAWTHPDETLCTVHDAGDEGQELIGLVPLKEDIDFVDLYEDCYAARLVEYARDGNGT